MTTQDIIRRVAAKDPRYLKYLTEADRVAIVAKLGNSKPHLSFSEMAAKKSRCQEAKARGEECREFS